MSVRGPVIEADHQLKVLRQAAQIRDGLTAARRILHQNHAHRDDGVHSGGRCVRGCRRIAALRPRHNLPRQFEFFHASERAVHTLQRADDLRRLSAKCHIRRDRCRGIVNVVDCGQPDRDRPCLPAELHRHSAAVRFHPVNRLHGKIWFCPVISALRAGKISEMRISIVAILVLRSAADAVQRV